MLTIHQSTARTAMISVPTTRDRPRDLFDKVLDRERHTIVAAWFIFTGLVGVLVAAAWIWL